MGNSQIGNYHLSLQAKVLCEEEMINNKIEKLPNSFGCPSLT